MAGATGYPKLERMRALGGVERVVDADRSPKHRAAWDKAIIATLAHRPFAVVRRIELQYVSLVAGLGLAVAAVFWLSNTQNAAGPDSKQASAQATATWTRAVNNPPVIVYLAGSQAAADATWAMEREEVRLRFESGSPLSRQLVVYVAETFAEQAAIRQAYTDFEVIELGHEVVFIDLVER